MSEMVKYYIVEKEALPEVFVKVVEAKRLLDTQKVITVQDAVEQVGISRSSFYKYKDSVSPFFESSRGKVITLALRLDDEPGVLSHVLNTIAKTNANILTIHQTIPINGIADITMSIQISDTTEQMNIYIETVSGIEGVHHIKILARE